MARIESKHKVRMAWAYGLTRGFCIALAGIPIYAASRIVEPLAGNSTQVELNMALGVSFGLSLAVNLGLTAKWRSQRSDLQRLRKRQLELEEMVVEL